MSSWISTKKIAISKKINLLPDTHVVPAYTAALSSYLSHKKHVSDVLTKLKAYVHTMRSLKKKEDELILSLSSLYPTPYSDPRITDFQYRFLSTPPPSSSSLSSSPPPTLISTLSQPLLDSFTKSVTEPLLLYLKRLENLNDEILRFEKSRAKYDHYVLKNSSIGRKAALTKTGTENPKHAHKLARNTKKLRWSTEEFDRINDRVTSKLVAASSMLGVKGVLDPVLDRLVQYWGVKGAVSVDAAREHNLEFSSLKSNVFGGIVEEEKEEEEEEEDGFKSDDEGNNLDSEDNTAYESDGWSTQDDEVAQSPNKRFFLSSNSASSDSDTSDIELPPPHSAREKGQRNYLKPYRPHFKCLFSYLPRTAPLHCSGYLSVRQKGKILSSKSYVELRGNRMLVFGSEDDSLFGVSPVYEVDVQSASEWDSRTFGAVVSNCAGVTVVGVTGEKVFLKSDEGSDDNRKWLKGCLRGSCWDGHRSKKGIDCGLRKVKRVSCVTRGIKDAGVNSGANKASKPVGALSAAIFSPNLSSSDNNNNNDGEEEVVMFPSRRKGALSIAPFASSSTTPYITALVPVPEPDSKCDNPISLSAYKTTPAVANAAKGGRRKIGGGASIFGNEEEEVEVVVEREVLVAAIQLEGSVSSANPFNSAEEKLLQPANIRTAHSVEPVPIAINSESSAPAPALAKPVVKGRRKFGGGASIFGNEEEPLVAVGVEAASEEEVAAETNPFGASDDEAETNPFAANEGDSDRVGNDEDEFNAITFVDGEGEDSLKDITLGSGTDENEFNAITVADEDDNEDFAPSLSAA